MYMKHCWDILLIKRNRFLVLLYISSQNPLWRRFSEEEVGWAIKECDVSYKCVSFPGTVTTSHHSSSYKSKSSSTVTSTSGHSSGSSSGAVAYRQQRPGAHFQQQQPLNLSQVSQWDGFWWCTIQLLQHGLSCSSLMVVGPHVQFDWVVSTSLQNLIFQLNQQR